MRQHRRANIAGGIANHERHQFRGGFFGGKDEIAFVLPIFVVNNNDRLACANIGYRTLDAIKFNLTAILGDLGAHMPPP